MRDADGLVVVDILDGCVIRASVWEIDDWTTDALLDIDDAASLGCLEGRMLAAWPGARITIDLDPWTVPTCVEVRVCPAPGEPCRSFFGRGEHARAEALVAALEAAPRREGA